jgi:hypothetical protein
MSFFNELKRRNVFRVGIAYLIGSWLLAQIAELLLDTFKAPDWTMQFIVVVLMIGFPIALFFAWAFELTPDGIKRESEVDRSESIRRETGQKLNRGIIVILVVALGYFVWESRFSSEKGSDKGSEPFSQESSMQVGQAGDEKGIRPRAVVMLRKGIRPLFLASPLQFCPSSTCRPTPSKSTSPMASPRKSSTRW